MDQQNALQVLIEQAETAKAFASGVSTLNAVPLQDLRALEAVESVIGSIGAIRNVGGNHVQDSDDHIISHFVEVLTRASFSTTGKLNGWKEASDGYYGDGETSGIRNILDNCMERFVALFPPEYKYWAQEVAREASHYVHSESANQAVKLMLEGQQMLAGRAMRHQMTHNDASHVDRLARDEAGRNFTQAFNALENARGR